MSFVLSFDTKLSNKGFIMVRDAIDFLIFSMKKRAKNPVGILLLDHLKDQSCTGSLQSFNEWLC
jgi:hypothetical protein